MKRITVTLNVDEEAMMHGVDRTGADTLEEAISQELNWLRDSGMSVENWVYADEARSAEETGVETHQHEQPTPGEHEAVGLRLEHLSHYKENEEFLTRAKEKKAQEKVDGLIDRIQALEPRIRELIATGNACMECKIPLTGQAFGMQESYETNQFFTNSWSHLVGFVGKPHANSCVIEYLGIDAGGACGIYDFRTDGVSVFSVSERNSRDIVTPSVGHMERFLNTFDTFEAAFYAYVDKVIENQKKSVDKLIGAAQEKATMQTSRVEREAPKLER